MGSSKFVHAIYNDDDVLLSAVKMVKGEKFHMKKFILLFLFTAWIKLWVLSLLG